MKRIILLLWIFLLGALFFGCAPKAEKLVLPETLTQESQSAGKESWEIEWEKSLALARKEGLVNIATARAVFIREGLTRAFKEKYDIDITWTVGRPAEITQKILTERRVGLYTTDIHMGGGQPQLQLKDLGVYQSLRAALILPEVKDEKAWWQGRFPFVDNEGKYIFTPSLYPTNTLHANTKLVPNYKEEFASYYDLLKPKWEKKILASDFVRAGGGSKWVGMMIEEDFGPILGIDFMKALARQEPAIIGDDRLAAEWMLKGKYPVSVNLPIDSTITEWRSQGIVVPVEGFSPKEGAYYTTGGQGLTFLDKAPHPNASRVFLNWVLSREGQILLSNLTIKHSTRIDIPEPEKINPRIIARDLKLNWPNSDQEKYLKKHGEYVRIAEEVFGHLIR